MGEFTNRRRPRVDQEADNGIAPDHWEAHAARLTNKCTTRRASYSAQGIGVWRLHAGDHAAANQDASGESPSEAGAYLAYAVRQ